MSQPDETSPFLELTQSEFEEVEEGEARGKITSRHPLTGAKRLSAEVYLGPREDSVSLSLPLLTLRQEFPKAARQLEASISRWEEQAREALEVDFAVSDKTLRILEVRPLQCSGNAASVALTTDVRQGWLSPPEAVERFRIQDLEATLLNRPSERETRAARRKGHLLSQGTGNGRGANSGLLALSCEYAEKLVRDGKRAVLLCHELSYRHRDALQVVSAVAVRTGSTLAAEQVERPSLVLTDFRISHRTVFFGERSVEEGQPVTVDSCAGALYHGALEISPGALSPESLELMGWCHEIRDLDLRANLSSPEDWAHADFFGASGVGIYRFEAAFQACEQLSLFQEFLGELIRHGKVPSQLYVELRSRVESELNALLREVGKDKPFTLRLLDAPLVEMLRLWQESGTLSKDYFCDKVSSMLHELNPAQGLRCGRLGIMFPCLMELQLEAALSAWSRLEEKPRLQIMMPGVCDVEELRILRACATGVAGSLGSELPELGSMLELPRACILAEELAAEADFLSFGTGDLTESTCGVSRYDSHLSFLPEYLKRQVFQADPFQAIDQKGVGALMTWALERVKAKYPSVEMGICGAQVVEPESLKFCAELGLDYISVPVHHLPMAQLIAAKVALRQRS